MESIKCLECDNMVDQTPQKRPKLYCSGKCRQKAWQNKRREELANLRAGSAPLPDGYAQVKNVKIDSAGAPVFAFRKKKLKGVIPDEETILAQTIQYDPTASFDAPRIGTIPDEPKLWQEAEVVKSELKLPTGFNEILAMAKAGVADRISFLKHVENTKMTPGQRGMIIAKLKP